MKKTRLLIISILAASQLGAWYPTFSVMVTDFELPYYFLASSRFPSISIMGLGHQFRGLYADPVENFFQNPAHLISGPRRYVYFDLSSDESQGSAYLPSGYWVDYWGDPFGLPLVWRPYQYTQEPVVDEPIFRALGYTRLGSGQSLKVGGSYEFFYNQTRFYQPYWYWGGWYAEDALGYAAVKSDPYDNYRVVESGDNEETLTGHRLNGIIALQPFSFLSLGLRYAYFLQMADGLYTDFDLIDDHRTADEYLSYHDTEKNRDQNYGVHDIQLGGILELGRSRLGASAGLTLGGIERICLESDTSYYYRFYSYPETFRNSTDRRHSSGASDREWHYDGDSYYGELFWWRTFNDFTLRISAYLEQRQADLTEKDTTWRHSYSYNRYYSDYAGEIRTYISESRMELGRTGSGSYSHERYRVAVGGEWQMVEQVRIIAGLAVDQRMRSIHAVEPFTGYQWSEYQRLHDSYHFEGWNEDVKEYDWRRDENFFTVAIPVGAIFSLGDYAEGQVGLTKLLTKTDITSGYDLIVYLDRDVRIENGHLVENVDTLFVDAHFFPPLKEFVQHQAINAAIVLKRSDKVKLTIALNDGIVLPRQYKLGVEFRW